MAVAAIVMGAAVFIFLLKRYLDRREKRKASGFEDLRTYAQLQEEALLKAYRMLFEQVNLTSLTEREFSQLVCRADDLILEPFTRYRRDIPEDVRTKIYNDLHSPLAQFRPDPTRPANVTPEARLALLQYKDRFLQEIESIHALIEKHLKGGLL